MKQLAERFKKDFSYYAVGLILPGIANAVVIPILKYYLGAYSFGFYSIRAGLMLLLVTGSIGWLNQVIVRFRYKQDEAFAQAYYHQMLKKATGVLFLVGVVIWLVYSFTQHDSAIMPTLFVLAFICCGYQNVFIAIAQSNFKAGFTLYSEAVRTFSFLLLALFFLSFDKQYATELLFIALICSYVLSVSMLAFKLDFFKKSMKTDQSNLSQKIESKSLFTYGLPLAFWFLVSYAMTYADKVMLAKMMGYTSQGHYQAQYDLISRGISFLLIPVSYALFPIMSKAFESKGQDESAAMQLLKKVLLIEIALLVFMALSYWFFGYILVGWVVQVPNTWDIRLSGFLMMLSAILWQINMLLHKPFEMRHQTKTMAMFIVISFFVYSISMILIYNFKPTDAYVFSLPFLLATLTYMFCCSISIIRFFNHSSKDHEISALENSLGQKDIL